MPCMYSNFGLDELFEEESLMPFMYHLASEGKVIMGYYEEPSVFTLKGDIDFFLKTARTGDKQLSINGIDVHCCGRNVWEMVNIGIDITPKDAMKTERIFMFEKKDSERGMLPVNLINADVLPSFLEGDTVKMQMCALPVNINYYSDLDEYSDSLPRDEKGEKWAVAEGSLIALPFILNHNPDTTEDKDYETDDIVAFTAKVKHLYCGMFEHNDFKECFFIRCIADTMFGELDFVHTYEQVPEEQRDKIKVGSVISGYCRLQGDVAINEYENGIVKDFENNRSLLRHTFSKGEAKRLRFVLTDDSILTTETNGKTYVGTDEIIKRFEYVYDNKKYKCHAYPATLIEPEEDGLEYSAGTKVIVLAYGEEDGIDSIVFTDNDEKGNISRILISKDSRYRFEIDSNGYKSEQGGELE